MRTFCITLPETPERTAKAKAHFASRQLDVQFFNGIHAEKFGLSNVFTYEVDNPGSGYNIGFKPTGIWLSHYMLWGALNLLQDDHYLILEVDAEFPENWRGRVEKAIADAPNDFDMLYIGSCCCGGQKQTHIAGEVFDVRYPQCLHAYVVAKKALPVLLETQRKVYAPIDISLTFHSHPLLKVFTVLPRIVNQFATIIPP